MSRINLEKWIFWALAVTLAVPIIKLAVPICLPFLLALAMALAAEPAVRWMHRRWGIRRSLAAGVGVTGVFVLSATVLTLLLSLLVQQLKQLAIWLPAAADAATQGVQFLQQWLLSLAENAPENIRQTLTGIILGLFQDGGKLLLQLAQKLPQIAKGALGVLSSGALWLITAALAAFMISTRLPTLTERIPPSWRKNILAAGKTFRSTIGRWLLAQGKLAAVAFSLMSVGFFLLHIRNGLLWAAMITMVDILPILGVGTVLLPWSLVSFLQDDKVLALGLLSIFAAVWLVRSVLEPKLISSELGLDPLLTLVCIYGGFRLWGIPGMLLAPVAAITLVQIYRIRRLGDGS